MTDLERDFLNILGGAVVGALLVIIWDTIRWRREVGRRDRASVAAILHSLDDNREICQENIKALRSEMTYLDENKAVVEPVLVLDDKLWQLLRLQLPRRVATNAALLGGISYIYQRLSRINRSIGRRERYRQANTTNADFNKRMREYDRVLIEDLESLWLSMLEYEHDLVTDPSAWQHLVALFHAVMGPRRER